MDSRGPNKATSAIIACHCTRPHRKTHARRSADGQGVGETQEYVRGPCHDPHIEPLLHKIRHAHPAYDRSHKYWRTVSSDILRIISRRRCPSSVTDQGPGWHRRVYPDNALHKSNVSRISTITASRTLIFGHIDSLRMLDHRIPLFRHFR